MSRIINNVILSGQVPKMLELPDQMVINGQSYDKSSLVAQPLCFYQGITPDNKIYLNTHAYLNSNHDTCRYTQNNLIIDNNDDKICYLISNSFGKTSISKVKIEDKVITTVASAQITIENANFQFIEQDPTYLYLLRKTTLGYQGYVTRINKNTLAFNDYGIGTNINIDVAFRTDSYIYLTTHREKDSMIIYKYDKNRSVTSISLDDSGTPSQSFFRCKSCQVPNENSVICLRNGDSFGTPKQIMFKKYMYNEFEDKIYTKTISVDYSIAPFNSIEPISPGNNRYYELYYTTMGDQNYLVVVEPTVVKKMYLFRFTSSTSMILTQIYDFSTSYISCIPYNNNLTYILCNSNKVSFINLSPQNERLELTSEFNNNIQSVDIDTNNNIWVFLSDNSVECLSNNIPMTGNVSFKDQNIEFTNKEIETNLLVYCTNYRGELLSTKVTLILSGPAKFKANDMKKLSITTSGSGVLEVPIIVNNSGYIQANITLI